jgi:hypothetical protein
VTLQAASDDANPVAPFANKLVGAYLVVVSMSPLYQVLIRVGSDGVDTLNALFIAGWIPIFLVVAWGVLHQRSWGLPGALWIATFGVRDVVAGLVRRPTEPFAVLAGASAVELAIFLASLAVLVYILSRYVVGLSE